MKATAEGKLISAGGQALIEGVLIRSKTHYAIAVRTPKGKIITTKKSIHSLADKIPMLKWPVFRGVLSLVEMLIIGTKALAYSANIATDQEEESSGWQLTLSLLFGVAFALVLFKYLPLLIATGVAKFSTAVATSSILFALIDGVVKILIFVLYIICLSFSKDIRRVFAYHGAEHQAVHCYEHRLSLTPQNLGKFPTMHARCGTSYLLYVLLLSILVYALLPNSLSIWVKYGYRILLLPFIAGIAYEVLKLAAKFQNNLIFKMLSWPGIALQKITTQPSDAKQREVAIAAMEKALAI